MPLFVDSNRIILNINANAPIEVDAYSETSKRIWECIRHLLRMISCCCWEFDDFLEISLKGKTVYILPQQIQASYTKWHQKLPSDVISQANLSLFIHSANQVERELPKQNQTYQEQLLSSVASLDADLTLLKSQGDVERQSVIGKILQSIVLPFYKAPMPRDVMRKDPKSGAYISLSTVSEANYQKYLHDIQNKKIAARRIHGAMHAVRVTLLTQILLRVYEKLGRKKLQDPVLLATAGGVHDIARQNDQIDYWDEESSLVLETLLIRANVDVSKRERYIQTIKEKDPQNGKFSTDEQRIVHDADCLDILRVISKFSFKKNLLCFWEFRQGNEAFCDQLFDQIYNFIKLTDTPALAQYLEHHSMEYYGDVVRILFAGKEKFPLICELIDHDMQGIKSTKTQASEHALHLLNLSE